MPSTCTARFDLRKRVAYDPDAKRRFHNAKGAAPAPPSPAAALGFTPCAYDLRSNAGGIAVPPAKSPSIAIVFMCPGEPARLTG